MPPTTPTTQTSGLTREQFQQMLDFAKANPTSTFTKTFAEQMKMGKYNEFGSVGTPKPPTTPREDISSPDVTKGFGQSIGDALYAGHAAKLIDKIGQEKADEALKLVKQIHEDKASGKTENIAMLEKSYRDLTGETVPELADITPSVEKKTGQILKEAGGTLAEILSAGIGGAAGTGAVYAFGDALNKNKKAGGIALETIGGALAGKVLEYGFEKVSPYLSKALETYGAPLFEKVAQYIPESAKASMKAIAEKVTSTGKDTGVVDAAMKKVGDVIEKPFEKGSAMVKSILKNDPVSMAKAIREKYTKAVRPSVAGKGTSGKIVAAEDKSRAAIQSIVDNKGNLNFDGESGRLPQSLREFSDAISQTKEDIFKKYDALQKSAGEAGSKLNLGTVADELEKVANDTVTQDVNPSIAEYAKSRAIAFRGRGEYTTEEAQKAIKMYNQSLEAFYKNPSYETASRAAIDSMIANNMRQGLDKVIEETSGAGYQELKNAYGQLKSIEKDVANRALVDARKNTKGLVDFSDIFTSEQILGGILTMNPARVAAGLAGKSISSYIKFLNDPNVAIKKMFEIAEKLSGT